MESGVRVGLMTDTRHDIPELDRKGLRQFGLLTGSIVAGLFGLFFPWLLGLPGPVWPPAWPWPWPLWPWAVFAVLGIWSLILPSSLRPVYRGWMHFGLLVSRVTTPIILGVVYFVVIVPTSFLMRLGRRDPMGRRFDKKTPSYRVQSHKGKHMEKPF